MKQLDWHLCLALGVIVFAGAAVLAQQRTPPAQPPVNPFDGRPFDPFNDGGFDRGPPRGRGGGGGRIQNPSFIDRRGVPNWQNDRQFKGDVFTFVRIAYRGGRWDTDYPDAELNFSYRLHELTAIETDPNGKVLQLTDDELFDYPFIYFVEPGGLRLSDAECRALRQYCLNGGFAMFDDFWGRREYENFYENIKRVFPEREPVELPLSHEIFHCVYDLKRKPQIPSIGFWRQGEHTERADAQEPYYKAIFDDEGRMMVIICHNTDLGDGWEREGEEVGFFKEYSEKWAYPMGINIVVYAMTH